MLVGRVPPPPLSACVKVLWYADAWQPQNGRERHMPDGTTNLIISLSDGSGSDDSRAIVVGPRSSASFIHASDPQTLIGAQFTHGGAGAFMTVPVAEVANAFATLSDVAGLVAGALRGQLLEANGAEARLDVLETWLMDRWLRRRDGEAAVAWAVQQIRRRPQLRIGDVAAHIGRSSRWFIDRFSQEVGLTPKVFGRVQRFHYALRRMHASNEPALVELAYAAGYTDQAHFTHEFRAIAGITPTVYLGARTEHPNHVADA